ncbi:MAG: hypothetical protein RIS09_181 [Actinomycetota bacterium]|jgi:menaquinone-specific isochorismate synthase
MSLAAEVIAPAAIPELIVASELLSSDHAFSNLPLISLLPAHGGMAWVQNDAGIIGWGEAARIVVRGRERFSRAQRWWNSTVKAAEITDPLKLEGTGLVAFSSFAFEPGRSVVVIPEVVVGRKNGQTWITRIHEKDSDSPCIVPTEPDARITSGAIRWEEGTQPVSLWQRTVANAIEKINHGDLDKVVLARDIVARADNPLDVRNLLENLGKNYPECWLFLVDGLLGATPELLIQRKGEEVRSRVLAGTIKRDREIASDKLAEKLLQSDKDQEEHEYAVASVAEALASHCTDLNVPGEPTVLKLANVQHLATEITGMLVDDLPVLALAAALHPTAAVCGTPTERAAALIRAIEGMDRGRYAGPVGWINANNDGELGIALRCGEIDSDDQRRIRLFAGCGIVAGSEPALEVQESNAKFEPMRNALMNS